MCIFSGILEQEKACAPTRQPGKLVKFFYLKFFSLLMAKQNSAVLELLFV